MFNEVLLVLGKHLHRMGTELHGDQPWVKQRRRNFGITFIRFVHDDSNFRSEVEFTTILRLNARCGQLLEDMNFVKMVSKVLRPTAR